MVDSSDDMGVFKWLRRERVTVTSRRNTSPGVVHPGAAAAEEQPDNGDIGTIRTEEYKRDLAEFQARRSIGKDSPPKKRCGRNSLPVPCTDCTGDADNTFNYEKRSAAKYKKRTHKRARSANDQEKVYDGVPNIQFLFQNQVFMPGNLFATYSEPVKPKQTRYKHERRHSPDLEFVTQKQLKFDEENDDIDAPIFYKNNSLPFDVQDFLGCDEDQGDKVSSHGSSGSRNKDDSCAEKMVEVMSELNNFDRWADEQLKTQSTNTSKCDDNKSDTSTYGLPVVSQSDVDVTLDRRTVWSRGAWGLAPVQVKRLAGVCIEDVMRRKSVEIDILRRCRHPNIILLMGLFSDMQQNVHIICEGCVDSLHGIIHNQGRLLSVQTSVNYISDIANALVFLKMRGYIHTELTSHHIAINARDVPKLTDVASCMKVPDKKSREKPYEAYTEGPRYVSIDEPASPLSQDCQPLISANASETYLLSHAAAKRYATCSESEIYRWQAPELFDPDAAGLVYVCERSDVYSLGLILWECCNAEMPWKSLSYEKLQKCYTVWHTGMPLPADGTYPGCVLALLQQGLRTARRERPDLAGLAEALLSAKKKLEHIEDILIPARLAKKKSGFSSVGWGPMSPADSEPTSPQNEQHQADIHRAETSTDSEREKTDSPMYETISKTRPNYPQTCYISDEETNPSHYERLNDKYYSSACSTPVAKVRARITETPGLHRSDSTEYCSILSPNLTSCETRSEEKPAAKLSRSFTPQSYKPLQIKVPDIDARSLMSLPKGRRGGRPSYNFDIRNYSLPNTPIARSNKLRKNAWLSGDIAESCSGEEDGGDVGAAGKVLKEVKSAPETPAMLVTSVGNTEVMQASHPVVKSEGGSPKTSFTEAHERSSDGDLGRDSYTGLRRTEHPPEFTAYSPRRASIHSWCKSAEDRPAKVAADEDSLAAVNVRPLVAIHERWIYEAGRKSCRSHSYPTDCRTSGLAVKPASHCVDTTQNSLPQARARPAKFQRSYSISSGRNGNQSEHFCQARDNIAKSMLFSTPPDKMDTNSWRKDSLRSTNSCTEEPNSCTSEPREELHVSDNRSIEQFVRDLIRNEFRHLLDEISDDVSTGSQAKSEELLNRGVSNVLDALRSGDACGGGGGRLSDAGDTRGFSKVMINGNNKPLLQITFSRSGENRLQVLDNCVNVTIGETGARASETETGHETAEGAGQDEASAHSLKRCQTFNAIQEARSTEDLYIDDDLSVHMQESFGGRVKLIPLHGSLHEILCERQDDCCLVKVKQENGCDAVYFRCDNSDTESRDALDGPDATDTVVYKRSISLVEERIKRVPKRAAAAAKQRDGTRPKSEVVLQHINTESKVFSNSSPSLLTCGNEEVEVNIENVLSYQDSSSDECLKCQIESDDFELLEKKIEDDIAKDFGSVSLNCGLEKISEESLSVIDEMSDGGVYSDEKSC